MVANRPYAFSRWLKAFWRRKVSFWGKLSSAIFAFCLFSIVCSSSWTYRYHRSSRGIRAQEFDKRLVPTRHVPEHTIYPPETLSSQILSSNVPVLDIDDLPSDSADVQADVQEEEPQLFVKDEVVKNETLMIIGILSDPVEDIEFRAAARATWVASAKAQGDVDAVFFFTQEHASDPSLQQEVRLYGDIVFGVEQSSFPAAHQMLELLAQQRAPHHILRVSVRSYVAVKRLLDRLQTLCARPGCVGEDIWAGRMITSRSIPSEDLQYVGDTGLSMYLPYMSSGAYLLSTSLVNSLSLMHSEIGLKLYGGEDKSLGVWLIPMAARRIDLGSAVHLERPCCVDADGVMTFDICVRIVEQYPVILSELERPEYVKQYHEALMFCPDQRNLL